jgi:hypothetical protein
VMIAEALKSSLAKVKGVRLRVKHRDSSEVVRGRTVRRRPR